MERAVALGWWVSGVVEVEGGKGLERRTQPSTAIRIL